VSATNVSERALSQSLSKLKVLNARLFRLFAIVRRACRHNGGIAKRVWDELGTKSQAQSSLDPPTYNGCLPWYAPSILLPMESNSMNMDVQCPKYTLYRPFSASSSAQLSNTLFPLLSLTWLTLYS